MNWYAKQESSGQGLVIEEETGRNVAVAYDEKDAALLAAAPEMANALRVCVEIVEGERDILKLSSNPRWIQLHAVASNARAALEKAWVAL